MEHENGCGNRAHSFFSWNCNWLFFCRVLQLHFAYQTNASLIISRWRGKSVNGFGPIQKIRDTFVTLLPMWHFTFLLSSRGHSYNTWQFSYPHVTFYFLNNCFKDLFDLNCEMNKKVSSCYQIKEVTSKSTKNSDLKKQEKFIYPRPPPP